MAEIAVTIVCTIVFMFLAAFPTMWVANYLFTPSLLETVFGVSAVGFWKAFWLNFFVALFSSASGVSKKR